MMIPTRGVALIALAVRAASRTALAVGCASGVRASRRRNRPHEPRRRGARDRSSPEDRPARAGRIAEAIRKRRDYRWVGVYDVSASDVALVAYSGPSAPAYPVFAVTAGLSGEAVRTRSTVVSNDVANDPRYLTAFGTTRAEVIVPVFDEAGRVAGTIDVESAERDAFDAALVAELEACALAVRELFGARR
jgi:putative methionine-R-sulfoxide reductase with GAF domain